MLLKNTHPKTPLLVGQVLIMPGQTRDVKENIYKALMNNVCGKINGKYLKEVKNKAAVKSKPTRSATKNK